MTKAETDETAWNIEETVACEAARKADGFDGSRGRQHSVKEALEKEAASNQPLDEGWLHDGYNYASTSHRPGVRFEQIDLSRKEQRISEVSDWVKVKVAHSVSKLGVPIRHVSRVMETWSDTKIEKKDKVILCI